MLMKKIAAVLITATSVAAQGDYAPQAKEFTSSLTRYLDATFVLDEARYHRDNKCLVYNGLTYEEAEIRFYKARANF